MAEETRTAFLSIVGKPNVGKSSLLNRMIGQKVAIVSNKPQTTRTKIMGVLTDGPVQLVFTDTPGYFHPRNKLGEKMMEAVSDSIAGVDAVLFVVEPQPGLSEEEQELLNKLKQSGLPTVLAINKIDTVDEKEQLMPRIAELSAQMEFAAIVPVCAVKGDGVDELLEELKKLAEPSVHFFPDDALTDQPERVIAAEIIREKMLRLLDKEVPHGTAVSLDRFSERTNRAGEDILDIDATIICERESHKGIIIGKQGSMLKKIGSQARHDIENLLESKVNLQLWVKVKKDWRDSDFMLKNFGYHPEDTK